MSDELRQFTATTQDGTPGHCFCAQVFDPDGNSIAELKPTDEPAIANQRAQWLADACNAHPADGDELVDEGWLRSMSVGWQFKEVNPRWEGCHAFVPIPSATGKELDVSIAIDGHCVVAHLGRMGEACYLMEGAVTRHQLRSLLAALGVNQ